MHKMKPVHAAFLIDLSLYSRNLLTTEDDMNSLKTLKMKKESTELFLL